MRTARILAGIIVAIALLCGFGWTVKEVAKGGRIGALTGPLRVFVGFPDDVVRVLHGNRIKGLPDSYLPLPADFQAINTLDHDLFVSNSFWNADQDAWEVKLMDLRTDSVLHTWSIPRTTVQMDQVERLFENAPAVHALVLPGRSLIAKLEHTPNLLRLDARSNVVWANHELIFHHAIQPDPDGTSFWVCASDIPADPGQPSIGRVVRNLNGAPIPYPEDYIVKVDLASGRILFKRGVCALLLANGQDGLLFGGDLEDPVHLNDITPVTMPSPYWRPGDLFLSLRQRSTVLLYRPSEDRIVDLIRGPFIAQHDVNVISDHAISLFDNHAIAETLNPDRSRLTYAPGTPEDDLSVSGVLVFDFADRTFHGQHADLFRSEGIRTNTQGIQQLLPNGDLFIEAQNSGVYYVISDHGIVLRKVFPTPEAGYVHGPNWSRIYPTLP